MMSVSRKGRLDRDDVGLRGDADRLVGVAVLVDRGAVSGSDAGDVRAVARRAVDETGAQSTVDLRRGALDRGVLVEREENARVAGRILEVRVGEVEARVDDADDDAGAGVAGEHAGRLGAQVVGTSAGDADLEVRLEHAGQGDHLRDAALDQLGQALGQEIDGRPAFTLGAHLGAEIHQLLAAGVGGHDERQGGPTVDRVAALAAADIFAQDRGDLLARPIGQRLEEEVDARLAFLLWLALLSDGRNGEKRGDEGHDEENSLGSRNTGLHWRLLGWSSAGGRRKAR